MSEAAHQHGPGCRIEPPVKTLMVLFDKSDMWHDMPLADAIVRKLDEQGIAGATVMSGVMGYGVHRRIHRKGLLGVPDDKPTVIIVVENEQKLRAVTPTIRQMVAEGLLLLLDCELIQ